VEPKNAASSENNQKAPRLWGWHTWLSIAIAIVILVILVMMVDLKEVWRRIAACNKGFVLLGALAHYATYPVRGFRWRRCLIHLPLTAGKGKFGLIVFFYNFVDNVVPAKLGDLYAAHLARINCGIPRSAALGSIVFLRTVDAWAVLFLATLSSVVLFSARLPRPIVWGLIGGGVLAVAASSIMLTFFVLKKSLPRWLPQRVQEIIHAFHTGMWPRSREVAPIAILTLFIWTLEVLWIFFLARGFGLKLGLAEAIFLTMLPLLATAFPLTPSGTGVVELTLFTCLRAVGVSAPSAASLTIVNRFIDHWLHIGLGLVIWAISRGIGLRTWREVPLEQTPAAASPDASVSPEVVHAG
jgi:uncharacterized protein (TIRG00374 family)